MVHFCLSGCTNYKSSQPFAFTKPVHFVEFIIWFCLPKLFKGNTIVSEWLLQAAPYMSEVQSVSSPGLGCLSLKGRKLQLGGRREGITSEGLNGCESLILSISLLSHLEMGEGAKGIAELA